MDVSFVTVGLGLLVLLGIVEIICMLLAFIFDPEELPRWVVFAGLLGAVFFGLAAIAGLVVVLGNLALGWVEG